MFRDLIQKIKKLVEEIVSCFEFELNDEITRLRIKANIEHALRDKCSFDFKLNCILDFEVVCDESNNTCVEIDKGQVIVHVHLLPQGYIVFTLGRINNCEWVKG
jgi:phage tail sheath protein FI